MRTVALILLAFCLVCGLMLLASIQQDCEAKGGALVSTTLGFKCAKVINP